MPHLNGYNNLLKQPNFWRLFIDGRNQKKSFLQYNREPEFGWLFWAIREPEGLFKSQQAAQKFINPENIHLPLTFELIEEMHQDAFPSRSVWLYDTKHVNLRRVTKQYFGELKREDTANCRAQASQVKTLCQAATDPWEVVGPQNGNYLIEPKWSMAEINMYFPRILDEYNKKVATLKGDVQVEYIAWFVQVFERMHIFRDGNCRAMVLLLNRELIKYKHSPVLLENPNDFDFLKSDDLLQNVKNGQVAYSNFKETGQPYDDCLTDTQIAENIKKLDFKGDLIKYGYEHFKINDLYVYSLFVNQFNKLKNNMRTLPDLDALKKFITIINESITIVAGSGSSGSFSPISFLNFTTYATLYGLDRLESLPREQLLPLFEQYIDQITLTIQNYQNKHLESIRCPLTCHVTDDQSYACLKQKGADAFKTSDFELAIKLYTLAYKVNKDVSDASCIFNIALCHKNLNNINMAEQFLTKTLKINPNYGKATAHLEQIKKYKLTLEEERKIALSKEKNATFLQAWYRGCSTRGKVSCYKAAILEVKEAEKQLEIAKLKRNAVGAKLGF